MDKGVADQRFSNLVLCQKHLGKYLKIKFLDLTRKHSVLVSLEAGPGNVDF